MKLILKRNPTEMSENDDVVIVQSTQMADMLVSNAEADTIIVEDFLSTYSYEELPNVINFILSKLRKGGQVTFSFMDGELAAYNLTRGYISLEEYNNLMFSDMVLSTISSEFMLKMFEKFDLTVESCQIFENSMCVITGVRA